MIDLNGIKNIIFDYGGVIINIDFNLTIDAFKKLGFENIEEEIFKAKGSDILLKMEQGLLSHDEFFEEIREISKLKLSNNEIRFAWNALLLDMPIKRIQVLERLKLNFRTFLLSNTNSIHYIQYREQLENMYGYSHFNLLFEKAWFSFELGLTKPNEDIFRFVINDAGIVPDQTLYIDDLITNVEAATQTGMRGYHLKPGEDIVNLFE